MTRKTEILFVDHCVSDLDSILSGLRATVRAVVLNGDRPAARQIAQALEGRQGLAAVHVMAHGSPGHVNFAAGDWSAATLTRDADDLAAIGRALAVDGDLRLWSCDTGVGQVGEAFIDALATAAGADVSAATARVGAAALGGSWELMARASRAGRQPPLSRGGVEAYAGHLATTIVLSVAGGIALAGNCSGDNVRVGELYYIVTQDIDQKVTIVGRVTAQKFSSGARFTTYIALPPGTYSVGAPGRPSDDTINLYVVNSSGLAGDGNSEAEGWGSNEITRTLSAHVVTGGVGASDFDQVQVHAAI